jgi:DNA helicase-2/ATP-dependent DNA helicase PcrA
VAIRAEGTPMDTREGRIYLSILHLLADDNDSLALRTLLMLRDNRIGTESYSAIYNLALNGGETFSKTAHKVMVDHGLIPRLGERIAGEAREIQNIIDTHRERFETLAGSSGSENLLSALQDLAEDVIHDADSRTEVLSFLESIVVETDSTNHVELLRVLSSSLEDKEQELDSERVNIMTMHKAKGLTANAVILVAAEDEYIPGGQIGEREGDERRLLYVSLSRARHFLVVTYCEGRTGRQRYTGRTSGQPRRTLTRFLRDAPIAPIDGASFIEQLELQLMTESDGG